MTTPRLLLSAALVAASIAPGAAFADIPSRDSQTALDAYVHARAADELGQLDVSAQSFAQALAEDPANPVLALHTLRQAIAAGDGTLAVQTALTLQKQGTLPPDGTLLLLSDAVQHRDWKRATALTDQVTAEKLFAFLTPMIRAWIAFGRHQDPFAPLSQAATPLAAPYAAEQRGLLLLAKKRDADGVAAIEGLDAGSGARAARLRIAAAAELQSRHHRDEALAVLTGDDPAIRRARAMVSAGARLPGAVDTPAAGIAELFARVAADLHHPETAPLGLSFARMATMLAPDDSEAWLLTATYLGGSDDNRAALAALANIPDGDPFIGAALDARVVLMGRVGEDAQALAIADAAAHAPGALASDWSRLGDLLGKAHRYGEAASAFAQALALAGPKPAAEVAWPLLLQQSNALLDAGDWPGAKKAAEAALAIAPGQPAVLNFLGYSEVERGTDVARGAALIAKAAALAPDDPAITDSLGWSFYVRGDLAKAIPLLERAAQGAPAESDINEHLGDAYWRAGRKLDARYAWHAALVVADDKDKARLQAKIADGPVA